MLAAVGKAVYIRHTESMYGSWMRDPHPHDSQREPRFWTTDPADPYRLCEFNDKNRYRKGQPNKNYTLPFPFVVSTLAFTPRPLYIYFPAITLVFLFMMLSSGLRVSAT